MIPKPQSAGQILLFKKGEYIHDLNQQLSAAASAALILIGGALGFLGTGDYLDGFIGKGAVRTLLAVGTLLGVGLSLGIGYLISRRVGTAIEGSIDGLSDSTAQVSAASSQVASASQSLAEGASVAASAIEETSSSLEEMSSMTKKALENSTLMTKTGDITFMAMKNSHKSLRDTDACMKRIGESGAEAAKIIKTSDDRLPDQSSGPQRRRGRPPGRGSGSGIRRRRRVGAQPGHALRGGGTEHRDDHR